eukprot:TRINITY_DN96748_c0_g1_i1.p1 TRINITY_DN96748_c0_g1~~TRINITY_DN96748_c0_g1_i1.p1  ORF type:complete len:238 (-),score=41.02 TRINITY_DN96748_c0_g1_i1:180-824(-)
MAALQSVAFACLLGQALSSALNITIAGDPVLRMPALPFTREELAEPSKLASLGQQMLETLKTAGGIGLAGPQVSISKRIIVVHDERPGIVPPLMPMVFVNPQLHYSPETINEDRIESLEGCLSVPGLRAMVRRFSNVTCTFFDPFSKTWRAIEATGHIAVLFQHETDHLDGTLYIDKFVSSTFAFETEVKRFNRSQGVLEGTWRFVSHPEIIEI